MDEPEIYNVAFKLSSGKYINRTYNNINVQSHHDRYARGENGYNSFMTPLDRLIHTVKERYPDAEVVAVTRC